MALKDSDIVVALDHGDGVGDLEVMVGALEHCDNGGALELMVWEP